ncbi:MAG: CCA tRNA nucleotidyltransferase [Euryarchaeota archaeon]|nr:CCA tRNA nucleotidyltransferase [Euryarchaeota archaeon]
MGEINFKNILKEIKPKENENSEIQILSSKLIKTINEIAKEDNVNAEAVMVGSVAKCTWLSGKADIDIFIKFPLSLDEKDLKRHGLSLGHKCIEKMGGSYEERYASHPYVTGFINSYKIDFVPCYAIKDCNQLKSAVDRTILHTEYVKKNLKSEQIDEVLLLKKFMESIGIYGSEFKVGGFSGYLCELLVIYYVTFLKVLKAAGEEWKPDHKIDLEGYKTAEHFNEPFVVVDPVDKNRNVAAPLTLQRMSEFVVASRNFCKNPQEAYFSPKIPKVKLNHIKNEFRRRETKTLLIIFTPPEIPADAIYPQLKKTENSLKGIIEREGFRVFDCDYWTNEDDTAIILLELDIWKLPNIKKHFGPYVWSKIHQKRFLEKYKDKAWIHGDRWVVEVERKYRDVESLLNDILTEDRMDYLKFGKHIKAEILKNRQIVAIDDFLDSDKCSEDVLRFFYKYLNKSMCLWR